MSNEVLSEVRVTPKLEQASPEPQTNVAAAPEVKSEAKRRSIFVFIANKTSIVAGNYTEHLCKLIDERLNAKKRSWRVAHVSLFDPVYMMLWLLQSESTSHTAPLRHRLFHVKLPSPDQAEESEKKLATHLILLAEAVSVGYSNDYLVDAFLSSVTNNEKEVEHGEHVAAGGGDCYIVNDVRTRQQLERLRSSYPNSITGIITSKTTAEISNDSITTSMFETSFTPEEVRRARFDFTVTTDVYNESLAPVVLRGALSCVEGLVSRATHTNAPDETI